MRDRSSATARIIAAAVVLADRDRSITPRPESGQAEWSERLLAADPAARRLLRCVRSATGRGACRLTERLLLPGIVRHYLCRKQWLAAVWNDARREGFRQLLVLGAGYDTLSLRIAASDSAVRIVEVDHPATQRARREVVESAGFARLPHLIAADLATARLAPSLAAAFPSVLDPCADLFVVAEGLLMYLDGRRVEAIVHDLAALPCPRVRLAFTFMEYPRGYRPAFRPQSPLVEMWLARRREPFRWGLEAGAVSGWVGAAGWDLKAYSARPGRSDEGPGLVGESGALAQRDRTCASSLNLSRCGSPREAGL